MTIRLPTSPKPSHSPTNLLVKILLILLILLLLPKLVEVRSNAANRRRHAQDKKYRTAKRTCESDTYKCGTIIPEENMNCVTQCISQSCFENIYSDNLLEDGEIDLKRDAAFESCVKKEMYLEKMRSRKKN